MSPRRLFGTLVVCATIAGCAARQTAPATEPGPQAPAAAAEGGSQVVALREEEISFDAAGMTVHGTLTLPAGDATAKRPAVLLIAGSGPTDRDWNSPLLPGRHGSAALLAKGLAERGIVVLRYDKRGTGKTGVPRSLSWEDYLAEQQAALALLRGHEAVDPGALYVAGHSEGGAHALRLAAEEKERVAGLILLSTAGRPLQTLVVEQVATQLRQALPPAQAEQEITSLEQALAAIAKGEQVDPAKVTAILGLQALLRAFQAPASAGFARELLVFDPIDTLRALPHRTLILSGEKDIQVSSERDVKVLAEARPDGTTLVLIPDADHVLKAEDRPVEKLGAQDALRYNAPDRKLAEGVVEAVAAFVMGG